jgi:polysaccharide export outer membrane protein
MRGPTFNLLMLTCALALCGCAHTGRYVWVEAYRAPAVASDAPYQLGPGDVLAIRVLGHEELSAAQVPVRTDGRISLPLNADLQVNGLSVDALTAAIQKRLQPYVAHPAVTVALEQPRPLTVSVVGEVSHPGVYPLHPNAGVLNALALAGGFTPYAHDDRIYVLRQTREGAPPVRIRFKYEALVHAEEASATFDLRRGDIVVVE